MTQTRRRKNIFIDQRKRFLVQAWRAREQAVVIDRGIRSQCTQRSALGQRAVLHDRRIASAAKEMGATLVPFNTAGFALIARYVDIDVVAPWPEHQAA